MQSKVVGVTPRPWRYVGFDTSMGAHVVIGHPTRDDVVCTVAGAPDSPVAAANGAQIAAAPDLLEACKALLAGLSDICEGDGSMGEDEDCAFAHAVIAKAEGRSA